MAAPAYIERHYAALPREGGFASRCAMALGGVDWAGKHVLDVGCRRGKGAYKLSERVGADGLVVGVDWSPMFVEAAREGVAAALARSGLTASNLEFRQGYPEDLAAAGIADGSQDVVYLNNGFAHFADPAQALRECFRALAPGGLLVLEVVTTTADELVAVTRQLTAAGFPDPAVMASEPLLVAEESGAGLASSASSAPSQLGAATSAAVPASAVLHARKPQCA